MVRMPVNQRHTEEVFVEDVLVYSSSTDGCAGPVLVWHSGVLADPLIERTVRG